jgi:hypothetical protein
VAPRPKTPQDDDFWHGVIKAMIDPRDKN